MVEEIKPASMVNERQFYGHKIISGSGELERSRTGQNAGPDFSEGRRVGRRWAISRALRPERCGGLLSATADTARAKAWQVLKLGGDSRPQRESCYLCVTSVPVCPAMRQHNCLKKVGAPGEIRTHDLCLRRAALYPAELRVPRMVSCDPGGMGYSPKAARARRDLRSATPRPKYRQLVSHSAIEGGSGRRLAEQALQLLEKILLQTSCRCSNARLAMQTRVVVDGSIDGARHAFAAIFAASRRRTEPEGRAADASRGINGSSAS